jgi:programmed cell death protein 4
MPLTLEKKSQSESIEDLIAQLDATTAQSSNHHHHHHYDENNSNHSTSSNSNNNNNTTTTCSQGRKTLKGKRVSTAAAAAAASPTTGCCFTTSYGQNSEPLLSKNILMSKKYAKHTKSLHNNNNNRGAAKKNGAGGKHTWGAPGCELNASSEDLLDTKDPNYDSEEAGNVVMVCVENTADSGGAKLQNNNNKSKNLQNTDDCCCSDDAAALKELYIEDMECEIKPVLLEYFQNGDTLEVTDHLKCYNYDKMKAPLIAYAVQLALEHNNTCKELMSRLLRDLNCDELFGERDFLNGFDLLLRSLNDITLDNPDAPEKSGTFIARAIADKVINKKYIERFFNDDEEEEENNGNLPPDLKNNEKVFKAIDSARLLINMHEHLYQLSHVWGNKGGGFLAVKELTDRINELIQELHDSGDTDEAIRCLKELNVPHFHHEFVFEALDFTLQKGNDHAIDLITNLLKGLCQTFIVTYDQLKMGFTRLFDILPDISLDVPNASAIMDKILISGNSKGFIGEDIMDLAPNRSRKRFVSEGDGGRVKENCY